MVKETSREFGLTGGTDTQAGGRAHFNQQFDRGDRPRQFDFDERRRLGFGPAELTESVGLSYFWRTMMLE